jgi:hypothetical protein
MYIQNIRDSHVPLDTYYFNRLTTPVMRKFLSNKIYDSFIYIK